MTLVSTIILARLLAPKDFGLVAMAMLAINLFDQFKDLGVGPALVQMNRPWGSVAPTGLGLTLGTSVAFSLGAALFAEQLASFLGDSQLTPIIQALAVSLFISGLAILPDSALRRHLEFRSRTIPEVSGTAVKAVVSIGLALNGFGAWSLVWGQVAASLTTTLGYWIVVHRHAEIGFHLGWSWVVARRLLSFGGWMSGVAFLSLILSNVDYYVIGRRLGATELGYYTMAFRLPEMLIFGIGMVIGQVLFASFSRLQRDVERLGRVYLSATSIISALMVPAAVGLAAAADPIVNVMLGSAYAPAIGALSILALRAAVSAISIYAGEAFKSIGRADILLRIAMVQVLLVVPLFWIAAGSSIYAVAGTFLAQTLLFALVQLHILRRLLGIDGAEQWALIWPTLLASAVMWLTVRLTLIFVAGWSDSLQLLIAVPIGVVTYAVVLRLASREMFEKLLALARRRSMGSADESVSKSGAGPRPVDSAADDVVRQGTPSPPTAQDDGKDFPESAPAESSTAPPEPTVRVLHVLDSYSFGGAENLLVELGRFQPAGIRLSVASLPPESAGRNEIRDRLADAGFKPFHFQVSRLLAPVGFARMVGRLRHGDFDVVHAHLGYSAVLVPAAARLAGIPCVATLHVMPTTLRGRELLKERLSIRSPQRWGRLVFVSQAALAAYAARYGPPADSWRMIHNGIDISRFERGDRIEPKAPVWAVVAALREEKGHLDLLRAWSLVVSKVPEARLIIAGDGDFEPRIRDEIRHRGLGANVSMVGRCDDVSALLATVTGVVSASHTEALPTSLIEAAAAGRPVVATDVGGTSEIVRDEVTGLLVAKGDHEGIARAVLRIHEDPGLAARLGAAAHDTARSEFSLESWVAALHGLYNDVMGTDQPGGVRNAPDC